MSKQFSQLLGFTSSSKVRSQFVSSTMSSICKNIYTIGIVKGSICYLHRIHPNKYVKSGSGIQISKNYYAFKATGKQCKNKCLRENLPMTANHDMHKVTHARSVGLDAQVFSSDI